MSAAVWERAVLVFSIVCHGGILWRLWSEKLTGVYRFLTAFFIGETAQTLVVLPLSSRTTLYEYIFLASTPVLWILAYFVVLELYRLILEDYPGIASAGRRVVSWSMVVAILIALAYAIPDLMKSTGPFPALRIYFILERSVVLALLLFLVLIQLFLLRYRLRLSPNRMIYVTGYAIYFALVVGFDVVITAMGVKVASSFDLGIVATSDLVLLAGAGLLSHKGEVKPKLETVDSSGERIHLQQQLTDINRLLSRAARGRG